MGNRSTSSKVRLCWPCWRWASIRVRLAMVHGEGPCAAWGFAMNVLSKLMDICGWHVAHWPARGWRSCVNERDLDVLVIGGGPAGIAAATLLAEWGQRVCLVE